MPFSNKFLASPCHHKLPCTKILSSQVIRGDCIFLWFSFWTAISLAKDKWISPRINYIHICSTSKEIISTHTLRGSIPFTLYTVIPSSHKSSQLFVDACFVNNRPKRGRL